MEDASQCMLFIIGATKSGDKELLSIVDGYRESEQSWLEALNDLDYAPRSNELPFFAHRGYTRKGKA